MRLKKIFNKKKKKQSRIHFSKTFYENFNGNFTETFRDIFTNKTS